jgi:ABC-type multidrug transport system ATPase subunit
MSLPDVVTYVGQLDVHAPYLTVRETFEFAYQSRNGLGGAGQGGDASASAASPRRAKASENLTIEGLGLDICQDTFVGNTNVRGISGGQRRRVSVGEMMQGQNPVACCDEISTGLDAAVTHEIVESIVNYSKAVLTTRIVSLLQPGPKTFALFDEVVVLCEGRIAYAGPVPDAVPYFNGLGYALPATVDAADFLQSVTTADGALLFDPLQSPRDEHYTPDEFAEAFAESEHGRRILRQLDAPAFSDWKRSGVPDLYKKPYPNGWGRSFRLNFRRHLTLWWRDKGFIIGKAAENIGMAVATGGILFGRAVIPAELAGATTAAGWTSADAVALQSLQDGVYSALFMTCLHILLGTTTSAPDDLEGRPIHYKHGDASFYQTSAYLLGKLAASLPQRTIEICSFGIPLYWMVGLDPTAGSFFLYLVIVLTYTFTLKILYAIFAQLLPNQQNVLSFGTFMVLLFGLFSGFIVYPAVIPNYYIWFYYANPVAWALQSLLLTEFTSSKYIPGAANALMGGRGFHTSRAWIGYNFVFFIPYALLCSAILIFVLKKVRIEPVRAGNGAKAKLLDDEDEEEESKDFNFPFIPVDLTFEDICYSVKASTGHEMLKLLNSVSGVMKGGRMCALMYVVFTGIVLGCGCCLFLTPPLDETTGGRAAPERQP